MSGHSKWAQIKHKKALTDVKRGQLFSKLVREITVASSVGGSNPDSNPRLRAALLRAKSFGLPKENIERALERAAGRGGTKELQEFLYEVIGPTGSYILVEGITDNKNRVLGEIKQILAKYGAKFVPPGSLLWSFERVLTEEGRNYKSKNPLSLSSEDKEKLAPFLDELLEHPDVQEVYTNLA